MIVKEYLDKDGCGKSRVFIDLSCDHCGKLYTRQKRNVKDIHFCSSTCKAFLQGSRVVVNCSHCEKPIERTLSQINKTKSKLSFCNRICKEAASKYLEDIRPEHYGTGLSDYRANALKYYGERCMRCGYDNPKALDVHHIDHNRDNNELDNLEVLCCNCHAIEHRD